MVITSDVIKDWKEYIADLLHEINVVLPVHCLITIFKTEHEQYEIEIFWYGKPEDVLKTIHAAKISNLQNKSVLFIVMTRGIHGDIFERKMEGIADCVLELEVLQKGSTFERFLAVKKMKNYAKKIGIARYAIDSDGFVLEMIERIM